MRERNPKVECRHDRADEALLALARLLGRHAARDFTLQQQEIDGRISELPVDDV